MQPSAYRPEIDGLRAIAVLAVVMFHAGFGFSGGYVGVDVFFVISGFLITGLILKAQGEGNFRLSEFWVRRVRRLFPAMAAMQIGVLTAGLVLMLPRELFDLARSSFAQVLLHANIFFADELDYFAGPAAFKPLLHTWSLAVEEQFYLCLPPLLVAIRKASQRTRVGVLLALTVASFASSVWAQAAQPTLAFYWLPFRAWELLLGSLLACAPPLGPSRARNEALGILGIAGIVLAIFAYDSLTPFPGASALLPCLSTALVIAGAADKRTLAYRMLSTRPFVGIGLISYSLYMFHWPVIVFMKLEYGEGLTATLRAVAVALSLALGFLSWKFVETPFRARRLLAQPRRLVLSSAAVAVGMVVAATVCWRTGGLPDRWDPAVRRIFERDPAIASFATKSLEKVRADDLPRLGPPPGPGQRAAVLVWGDSHAAAIGTLCDSLAHEFGITGYLMSRGGAVPLLETWRAGSAEKNPALNAEVLEFVRRNQIPNVILIARWAAYVEKRPSGLDDALIKDRDSTEHSRADSRRVLERGLERTIAALHELGARVWLMKQVPRQREDPIRKLVDAARRGEERVPTGVTREQHAQRQYHANRILEGLDADAVSVLDPADSFFDASDRSRIGSFEAAYYSDDHHVSAAGAEHLLRPLLAPVFEQIAGQQAAVLAEPSRGIIARP